MNRREMEELVLKMEELVLKMDKRLNDIEKILNVSETSEPNEYSLFGYVKKMQSLTIIDIKKQIKLLSKTLGYEFKPESTKKEPAKFVKKTKKEKK